MHNFGILYINYASHAGVAQLVVHSIRNRKVTCSSHATSSKKAVQHVLNGFLLSVKKCQNSSVIMVMVLREYICQAVIKFIKENKIESIKVGRPHKIAKLIRQISLQITAKIFTKASAFGKIITQYQVLYLPK